MTDDPRCEGGRRTPAGDKGPLLLAAGGLAAAFAAASCCGLPVLLGSVGLGSAWLVALAWLAAPHRTALLVAAAILLAGGAGAFIWRRRTAACRADAAPAGPGAVAALAAIVLLGGALAVLGYLYA